jgi:hypothetical protein
MSLDLNKSLGFEQANGLSHGRATDIELPGNEALIQLFAGLKVTLGDGVPQIRCHLIDEGFSAVGLWKW